MRKNVKKDIFTIICKKNLLYLSASYTYTFILIQQLFRIRF